MLEGFEKYKEIAKSFCSKGMSSEEEQDHLWNLMEKHKSPILNHLIYLALSDSDPITHHLIVSSPYTNVSTLSHLYWMTDPLYWVKREMNGEKSEYGDDLLYQEAKERLLTMNPKEAIFSNKVNPKSNSYTSSPRTSVDEQLKPFIPVAALADLEGMEIEEYTLWN